MSVSDIEGSHHSVAEAMATGTIPFIYGKALKEYKLDKIYPIEYCFYDNNIKNLCSKIIYYSKNDNIKNKKSNECIEFAKKKFTLNNIFDKYYELLSY